MCKMQSPVSRAYDIWTLGCVHLEFITWLLKRNAHIGTFSEWRGNIAASNDIDDDKFLTLLGESDNGPEATVRHQVKKWVEQLHEHERCSQLIHDLLDLIMRELLLIDSNKRMKAFDLDREMKFYHIRASTDKEYMLKPVPWPRSSILRRTSVSHHLEEIKPQVRENGNLAI